MEEYLKDGFVSSAEDLLKQFSEAEDTDCIYYNIHNVGNNVDDVLAMREAMMYEIRSEVEEYIWYHNTFELKVVLSSSTSPHLGGRCEVGVAVEDEWFIVYLLRKLSVKFPEVFISIVDRDGQFLLIEAADHLPDWLGPDNSQHRIWMKNGDLHIIPLEEYGRQRDGSLRLDAAVALMTSGNCGAFKAKRPIQDAIKERIRCYPAQIRAAKHTSPCILHGTIAKLLLGNPSLLSPAILAACETPMPTSKKKKDVSLKLLDDGDVVASDMVTVNISMSKIQYAKLNFRRVAKFPALQSLEPRFHSHSSVAYKAFDIGCRLTAGLELLYRACVSNKLNAADVELVQSCLAKCRAKLPPPAAKSPLELMSLFYIAETGVDATMHQFNEYVRLKTLDKMLSSARSRLSHIDIKPHILTTLPHSMHDEWMYMTPEDFEKHMNDLITREEQKPAPVEVQPPEASRAVPDITYARNLVKGVSDFIDTSSDVDGVIQRSIDAEESIYKELPFDMNKFLSILSGKDYPSEAAKIDEEPPSERDDFYASDYDDDDSDDDLEDGGKEVKGDGLGIDDVPVAEMGVKSFLVSEDTKYYSDGESEDSDDFRESDDEFDFDHYMVSCVFIHAYN